MRKGITMTWKHVLAIMVLIIVILIIWLVMNEAYWKPLSEIAEREIGPVL